jgi:hypothetical protein
MAYLVDIYELWSHWGQSIFFLYVQSIAGDVNLEKCKEIIHLLATA